MRKVAALLAVLLVLGATVAVCWLVNVWHESNEQEVKMDNLRQRATKTSITDLYREQDMEEVVSAPTAKSSTASEPPQANLLHDIELLQKDSPDCIGWVSIPGTPIDFPVMQNGEFYLKHDFDGNYTDYGLPFLDERCSLDTSDNLIIYGHHMNDGSMFSALLNYEDKAYFEQHPDITFETVGGVAHYKVAAVIRAAGNYAPGEWSVFDQININTDPFNTLVEELKERRLYDTGRELAFGDKLLTLVTCGYSQNNGRLAVIAVRQ